jgi:sigma-E factor negative regulatory protein RseC
MATEEGIITKVNQSTALVRTARSSACESCSERGACTTLGGGRQMEVEVLNPLNAKVGDTVVISFKTSRLLGLSFFLYVFPIIAMIAGALLGDHIAADCNGDHSAYAAGLGFFAFFIAMAVIKLKDRQARKTGRYKPVIVGIKKRGGPHQTG